VDQAATRDQGAAAVLDLGGGIRYTGWGPLHVVCASRWHRDPARAQGLLAIARLLLDGGADVLDRTQGQRCWWPLRCAIISAASSVHNEPIIALLLEHGATAEDQDLYSAGFAADPARRLRVLIDHGVNVAELAEQALAGPISTNNVQVVRVLLEAGADPARYRDDEGHPTPVVPAAVTAGCDVELIELLLTHGADPDAPGLDGRSAYRVATAQGRSAGTFSSSKQSGHRMSPSPAGCSPHLAQVRGGLASDVSVSATAGS
jgi:ankyrin repeat protein